MLVLHWLGASSVSVNASPAIFCDNLLAGWLRSLYCTAHPSPAFSNSSGQGEQMPVGSVCKCSSAQTLPGNLRFCVADIQLNCHVIFGKALKCFLWYNKVATALSRCIQRRFFFVHYLPLCQGLKLTEPQNRRCSHTLAGVGRVSPWQHVVISKDCTRDRKHAPSGREGRAFDPHSLPATSRSPWARCPPAHLLPAAPGSAALKKSLKVIWLELSNRTK